MDIFDSAAGKTLTIISEEVVLKVVFLWFILEFKAIS